MDAMKLARSVCVYEFIVDFNFMRPGVYRVLTVPVESKQFTIKRNIYELTRTNFIISILVKTLFTSTHSLLWIPRIFFPATQQISLFVITFVARLMHFDVLLFAICINCIYSVS